MINTSSACSNEPLTKVAPMLLSQVAVADIIEGKSNCRSIQVPKGARLGWLSRRAWSSPLSTRC